eukprot:TRINITY_DN14529_c3_g1_i1.p1 TRINITY_DN14529_c3_g1~~TRINITY_DN14529_c3_g1_i1.p1  ORF type:complete len:173 (+),score=50.09 TRINITY_DN14529_c3_g1_i1:80-598(+)
MPGLDYSKWDKIEDSDDEVPAKKSSPPPAASKPAAAPSMPVFSEEHGKPLDAAPELEVPDGAWLQFYTETMTAPQRMQTLVHFWNSADQEQRVGFLRHLIELINDPKVSNRIKGGQEVLKDLDVNYYNGVTYPEKWLETFKGLEQDDKKVAFEKLFKALDAQERSLVIGTLM